MRIRRKKTVLEQAADYVEAAVDTAVEKAGPTLADAKDTAVAKAAEVADATKPKKKHRVRTFLILTGLAAAIGFVVKKMQSRDEDNWQSSYNPPPPPARDADRTDSPIGDAAAAAASTKGADEGGAGPDEALADAVEESHEVTTPEDPAEVVDLEAGEEAAANKTGKG